MFQKKSLGQNFLQSKGIVSHIISASNIKKGDLVLEIGPGQGFLTEDLIKASGNVLCIEKDHRLISELEEKFNKEIKAKELEIFHKDVLDFDTDSLKKEYKVVANIPYYITGAIIKKFLTCKNPPKSITLMVQKEVAERIAKTKNEKGVNKESVLSLSVKAFGEPEYIRTVKKENFFPVPKVDSAILLIKNISKDFFENSAEQVLFFEIIKKAFGGKRKKIGTTLKNYRESIQIAGIDVNKRPEDLKIEEWISITKEIDKNLNS